MFARERERETGRLWNIGSCVFPFLNFSDDFFCTSICSVSDRLGWVSPIIENYFFMLDRNDRIFAPSALEIMMFFLPKRMKDAISKRLMSEITWNWIDFIYQSKIVQRLQTTNIQYIFLKFDIKNERVFFSAVVRYMPYYTARKRVSSIHTYSSHPSKWIEY